MAALEIVSVALSVFDKLLDQFPNYSQRQRKKYSKLKRSLRDEMESSYPDHGFIDTVSSELMQFITSEVKTL